MANILIAWELGAGSGHLVNVKSVATALAARGHRVFVVIRELARARRFFPDGNVALLQAPIAKSPVTPIVPTYTYAQLLYNNGFADPIEMAGVCEAWRHLFRYAQPDVALFEHSPMALLAARSFGFKRATIGHGFFVPADETPLPNLRVWLSPDPEALYRDELRVLDNVNSLLRAWRLAGLERLSQLYHPLDDYFVFSWPETDHFPHRVGVRYLGVETPTGGARPEWPSGTGPKIFAYLKPFEALPALLDRLVECEYPTVLVGDGLSVELREKYQRPTLRIVSELLDFRQLVQGADLAIVNAGHGTSVGFLLAGKPILMVPLQLEQEIFSRRVKQLGAGLVAGSNDAGRIIESLDRLVGDAGLRVAAGRFANCHAAFSWQQSLATIAERVEQMSQQR